MKLSWQNTQHAAVDLLRELIRLDTSNPPGNERLVTDHLSPLLGQSGLDPVVIESAPTRANLVARLKGSDPSKESLMLSSHSDVVPVERQGWSCDPFGAEQTEGCVWGRGALDMKGKLAMDVIIATAIQRAGLRPARDLILAVVADEEAGSDLGARFMVDRHPDLVRAGYVLNEVGGFTMHIGERRFYPIQVAERGFVTVRMTVRGRPGHGSMPRADSAIVRLAEVLIRIARTPMRVKVTPVMRQVLSTLRIAAESAPPLLQPMLSNTVSPTIVRAGYKDNVSPGEAWVVLDGRTLPGEDPESFMAELRAITGDEVEFELLKTAPPVEATAATDLFELIKQRTEAADPGAQAIPWMIPGATDNKFYAKLGAICYGYSPVKLSPHIPFGSLFHGNDERVPVDGFLWGLRLYAEVVLTFLGLQFTAVFE